MSFPESGCIWPVASCTALLARRLSDVYMKSFGSNSLRETKCKVMVTGAICVTKETCKKGLKLMNAFGNGQDLSQNRTIGCFYGTGRQKTQNY